MQAQYRGKKEGHKVQIKSRVKCWMESGFAPDQEAKKVLNIVLECSFFIPCQYSVLFYFIFLFLISM